MGKSAKKTSKGSRTKKAAVKDLNVKDAKAVKGGQKGTEPFMNYKLTDVIITS